MRTKLTIFLIIATVVYATLVLATAAQAQILVGWMHADLKRDGLIWNPGPWDGPVAFTWGGYAEITPHYPIGGIPPLGPLTLTSDRPWVNGPSCLSVGPPLPVPAHCAVIELTFYEGAVVFEHTTFTPETFEQDILDFRIDRLVSAFGSATFADGRVELLEGHGVSSREFYGTWRADLVQSPEPSTFLLFASGLVAILAGLRARRKEMGVA